MAVSNGGVTARLAERAMTARMTNDRLKEHEATIQKAQELVKVGMFRRPLKLLLLVAKALAIELRAERQRLRSERKKQ